MIICFSQISDPAERVIKSGIRESTGTHEVIANLKGRYTYCFSNRMSSVSDKSVSFNVHDVQKQGADSGMDMFTVMNHMKTKLTIFDA